ncbi:MAG: amidophosphoribosyltransferase [Bacteroidales bacterium]
MEQIKHECGIAMVRLLKPLSYYVEKYGSHTYGMDKLYLLMEKQHNRGQEGAGVGCVKLEAKPGEEYIFRERAMGSGAIKDVFAAIQNSITSFKAENPAQAADPSAYPFIGQTYLGHLRYSTTGRSGISYVHPFLRRNNWKSRNVCLAGNFNLTNVDEVFNFLVKKGQHPRHNADTFILLEQLGFLLDEEVERLYQKYSGFGYSGQELNEQIESNLKIDTILSEAGKMWDGGFVICGLIGSGDMFSLRDPWGIRPAFYYADEEVVVIASERPVIQTAFNLKTEQVKELLPGQGIIVSRSGEFSIQQIIAPKEKKACSFERIYFSRGSDFDIYRERKMLGRQLVPSILNAVDQDLENTVFSYIPNTAEVAYYGMVDGLENHLNQEKITKIKECNGSLNEENLQSILSQKVRFEKIAIKDIKLRTFIAEGDSRNDLATHVYDITYGSVVPEKDNVVVIDDSIVRGTTLKQSIIRMLDRLSPKKIVVVSSSPQIRFPDCYGIDMSRMGEFIAFNAAMELLQERGMQHVIRDVYEKCKAQTELPKEEIVNYVKEIYAPFSQEEISAKIAQMVTASDVKAKVEIVYQTIEDLHKSCPDHTGDWYFSGNYPTPGGNRLVNFAFINYIEGTDKRFVE